MLYGNAVYRALKNLFLLGGVVGILLSGCGGGGSSGAPIASFTTTLSSGAAPLAVSFDASGSSGNDGQITDYSWDFGDGKTGIGVTASHTFTNPGNFTVTLTVSDNSNDITATSQTISATGTLTTISGVVTSATGSAADGDVNNINARYVANDTPAEAQLIANPVILAGYLNAARTGSAGRSFVLGDRSDFFRISLAANQSITVDVADFDTGDLDLYLYNDDGDIDQNNPDFSSIGVGQTETLTVLQGGNYVIEVRAYSGFSNYALVVGQSVTSLSADNRADRLVSTDDFVPGEVIVRFKDVALTLSANQTPDARAATLGLQAKAGVNGRAMLLGLGDLKNRQASFAALGINLDQGGGQARQFHSTDPNKQLKMDTLQVIKALRKRNDVLYAEPNFLRQAKLTPSDQFYRLQWHYPLINLPSAWDVSTGSSNVIVAVVDTGVLLQHPDLQGQLSTGYDFILNDSISQDGEPGIDANPNDPGDSSVGSSSFHGTHVSGTIAAATSFGGGGVGVAGVAPGVKIMPLRALGNGGGTSYDIMQAVRYAAGLPNDSGTVPAQKSDVINLSLGGGGNSQLEQDVFTLVRNAGVIVVAAAGNENSGTLSYPASYTGVISVSAVDINKQRAPYSNFGATVDVAAPGGDMSGDINGDGYSDGVLSTGGDDSGGNIDFSYPFFQGTSMAAPHMAGVVALMKSIYSNLTFADVDNLLSSAQIVEDLGTAGRDDQFGHGLIDARKAVDEATLLASGVIGDSPFVNASPASLNFGSSTNGLSLSVVNGGPAGALTITSIVADASATWLTVTPDSVDVNTQLGSYQVTVDRSALTAGTYTANITITSSANIVIVPVIQQVAAQGASAANAGYHYILLIDADTSEVVDRQEGNAQNGNYNFQFDKAFFSDKRQRYFIIAGSDRDNDGLICDAGEACGAYLSRTQPKIIADNDNLSGLNFITGFSIGLQSQSVPNTAVRSIRRLSSTQITKSK